MTAAMGSYGLGIDPPEEFDALRPAHKRALLAWIEHTMCPAKTFGRDTSYSLKHILEDSTSIYVSNGTFKGAMLAAGYTPRDRLERNWTFNVRPRKRRRIESETFAERTGYVLTASGAREVLQMSAA